MYLLTVDQMKSIYYAQKVALENFDNFPEVSKEFLEANIEAIENNFLKDEK